MGWKPTIVRQWTRTFTQWNRCAKMDNGRCNKKIFKWSFRAALHRSKNWAFRVRKECEKLRIHEFDNDALLPPVFDIDTVRHALETGFLEHWEHSLTNHHGTSGGSKLRTYRQFKTSYGTEQYLRASLPVSHRSAFAKFRSGTAPIRLETGRYEHIPVEERTCFHCSMSNCNIVESEVHVITECPLYDDLRLTLYTRAQAVIPNFLLMSSNEKFKCLFQSEIIVNLCAKTCNDILTRRRNILYT